MIKQINRISKVKNILERMKTVQFNSSLPISIEVKEKIDPLRYLLLIGNKELSTKSYKKLETGAKYWSSFKTNKDGMLNLSNLVKKPSFFQKRENFFLSLTPEKLLMLLKKKNPKKSYKSTVLEKLALSSSRNEFLTLGNILSALNEDIFIFPIKHDNKEELFQLKKTRGADLNQKVIEFYGAFENFGPIGGKIKELDNKITATVMVSYQKTYYFLKEELQNLGFKADIYLKDDIVPLYENPETLLDIKG